MLEEISSVNSTVYGNKGRYNNSRTTRN